MAFIHPSCIINSNLTRKWFWLNCDRSTCVYLFDTNKNITCYKFAAYQGKKKGLDYNSSIIFKSFCNKRFKFTKKKVFCYHKIFRFRILTRSSK